MMHICITHTNILPYSIYMNTHQECLTDEPEQTIYIVFMIVSETEHELRYDI